MMKKIISKTLVWSGMLLAIPGAIAAIPGILLIFIGEAFDEEDCNEIVRKGIEKEKNERDRGKQ